MKRYKEIDILKGVAITLVLLGHAIIFFPINLHEISWCQYVFTWLSTVHMFIFFAVSGFCFSYKGGYLSFVYKKFKRLIVPYLVFNMADTGFRVLLPQFVNQNMTLWEAVKKIILDGGSLWFLYTLFVVFLIFPALTLIYDKLRVSRYIIPVVFFGLMIVSPYAPSTLTLSCVTRYLFMFYIGFVVKKNFSRLAEQGRKIKIYALSISSVSFVMWCAVVYVICYVRDVFILNVVAGFLGMICIVPLVMRFSDSVVLKPFESIGKYSLQLYIFNGFTLTAARIVIVNFLGVTSPVIVILFNMFVTLVVTYFVTRYIVFKIKPLRFLCGG